MRLSLLLSLVTSAIAVFKDDAGVVDFHISLIGRPQNVRFHAPVQDAGSLCYVLTERDVLAALSCKTGELLWRQRLTDDRVVQFEPSGQQIITLSDAGILQAWNAEDGRPVWTNQLSAESAASALHVNPKQDAVYTVIGQSIFKVSAGALVWRQHLPELASNSIFISSDATNVYVVIPKASTSTAHASSGPLFHKLSSVDGRLLASDRVATSNAATDQQVLALSSSDTTPIVIWSEGDKLIRVVELGDASIKKIKPLSSFKHASAQVRTVPEGTILLLQFADDHSTWSEVYELDGSVHLIAQLQKYPLGGATSRLVSSGPEDLAVVQVSLDGLNAITTVLDALSGKQLASESAHLNTTTLLVNVVDAEISVESSDVAVRVLVTTADGALLMLQNHALTWERDEGLSDAKEVLLVQLPEPVLAISTESAASSTLLGRFATRWSKDLLALSAVLTRRAPAAVQDSGAPQRDHFGFRQFALAFGDHGRVWALDTGKSGAVQWRSRSALTSGSVRAAWQLQSSAQNEQGFPIVAVAYDLPNGQGLLVRCINALTGQQLSEDRYTDAEGIVSLPGDNHMVLGLVQSQGPVRLLGPLGDDALAKASLQKLTLVTPEANALAGYGFSSNQRKYALWRFELPAGETLVAHAVHQPGEPIASVGRVLGDRGVLFKYLNRATAAVLSYQAVERTLTVSVLDARSGAVLHEAVHAHVGDPSVHKFHVVLSENWLAYHYWVDQPAKGYQFTVTELYEGPRNTRLTGEMALPYALSKSYIFNYAISFLSVTDSGQGITSRDLIVGLANGQLTTVSRKLLDPRRPATGKLSAADKEEMLIAYDPVLRVDPKQVLSHANEVFGMRHVAASATLLESTALVCVYGLDLFLTRVSPSMAFDTLSESFSKAQIILSVGVLIVAIAITRPMAQGQQLKRRWIG